MAKLPAYFSSLVKSENAALASALLDAKKNSVVSTGSYTIDWATKGGVARGELTLLFGTPGCLSGDTIVTYSLHDDNGNRRCQKKTTLKHLYERFNKVPLEGKGNYPRKVSARYTFRTPAVDESGVITNTTIEGVVYSGVKECFEVSTEGGHRITATADHRFLSNGKYVPLSGLSVGSSVTVHTNKHRPAKGRKIRNHYHETSVKYHPTQRKRNVVCNGITYTYCRVRTSRLVMEANLNGMTFADYQEILNTSPKSVIDGMRILSNDEHVHHKNHNHTDNRPENLEIISLENHSLHHANPELVQFVTSEDKIASIRNVGCIDTFDIQCKSPLNNFVANGFVVHNSAKTTLMLKMMAHEQKAFPDKVAVLIDTEYSFDANRAKQLGVDVNRLVVFQSNMFEDAVAPLAKIASDIINDKSVCFIGLDSVKGFQSINEQAAMDEGKVDSAANAYGGISKSINPTVKILLRLAAETNCMVILCNHANMNMDPRTSKYYPYVLTGGQLLKHLCSTTIFMEKVENKKSKMFAAGVHSVNEAEISIGNVIRLKVTKSRRTVEGKVAEVAWNLETGDFEQRNEELFRLACSLNVLRQEKQSYHFGPESTNSKIGKKDQVMVRMSGD
jgi:RecA/RadA recombinase